MASILTIPALNGSADWTPAVGELVANFGVPARVVSIREDGTLVLREAGTLAGPASSRSRWIASPALCRPAR